MKVTYHPYPGILLTATFLITLGSTSAESRCPGNLAGLRPRLVAGALLVLPVQINSIGPFDFIVDTGSQLNVIDPVLADSLGLKSQGTVGLIAVATRFHASMVTLDSLRTGPHEVVKSMAAIQDLGSIQAADPRIRGVLGENFLAHFDVLIDYKHTLVCLDEATQMEQEIQGERIPLMPPSHPEHVESFSDRLVIPVNLSATGDRQILLQLDSGTDGPILYSGNAALEQPLLSKAKPRGANASEAQRAFAMLPPQDVRIGCRTLRKVLFVTPANTAQDLQDREEDGVLATMLFQRVYVSHTGHYVVFDPR
jgi:Aspartyl protease